MKTGGKSSRHYTVMYSGGKPCVLKCHIGFGILWMASDSLALNKAEMGRQLDPVE